MASPRHSKPMLRVVLHLRLWAVRLAVVLPLLTLALLPAGVMPGQSPDGHATLVLCSGNGPVLMTIDPTTGALKQAPHTAATASCDWAMAQASAHPPAITPLPAPPDTSTRATVALAALPFRPAHDPRGLYARGPPTLLT